MNVVWWDDLSDDELYARLARRLPDHVTVAGDVELVRVLVDGRDDPECRALIAAALP